MYILPNGGFFILPPKVYYELSGRMVRTSHIILGGEMMRVGIVGYGNLGRAVEKEAIARGCEVTGIFSRRKVRSQYGVKALDFISIKDFNVPTDIMLLCGGSKNDLVWQSRIVASRFNTADAFDVHQNMRAYMSDLNVIQNKRRGVSVVGAGWDPGIFSVARTAFCAILMEEPYTFWGRGASEGHGEAVRGVSGVKKAVQYTVPDNEVLSRVLALKRPDNSPENLHRREVYVVKDDSADEKQIEYQIKNMENYFKGYDVSVTFVSDEEFMKNHTSLSHGGRVVSAADGAKMDFSLSLNSNPDFTAKILLTYAGAGVKMYKDGVFGALSVLDVPPKYLCHDDDYQRFL